MSKFANQVKSFRVPERDRGPVSNKLKHVIKAGLAAAGPPLGPLLGKFGINIAAFCKDFNNKTSHYIKGLPLPCTITVNPDRTYNIAIGKPETSYYLMQAAGINCTDLYKGICGKVTVKHIYEIAKIKHEDPNAYFQLEELDELCKKFIAEAYSMGIRVEKEIDPVEYGEYLKERKVYLEQLAAELAAEQEAKLLRG